MFKIAHLSDFHIRADWKHSSKTAFIVNLVHPFKAQANFSRHRSQTYDPDLFSKTVSFIKRHPELKLVVISGDLAGSGMASDQLAAREEISRLSAFGIPIMLMPGNHDRYYDYAALPGCTEFDNVFSSFRNVQDHVETRILEDERGAKLAVISGDFCLRSQEDASRPRIIFRYGQGNVYGDVLDRMKSETESVNAGAIWVIHFPPSDDVKDTLKLHHWDRVIEAAEDSGVKYILSGHLHRSDSFHEKHKKGVTVLCAGAACADPEPEGNWLHILEFAIEDGNLDLRGRSNYRWHEKRGEFERAW
ncbi:MAG TPA: metallophosphoesterase [Beijerinckiaceae bacterium]|jgi:predicted MPP superfamily phosphohydrolase